MSFSILFADRFSFDESGIFGRAFANRRILQAILACETIDQALVIGDLSPFTSLPPDLAGKLVPLNKAAEVNKVFASSVAAVFCSDFATSYPEWIFYRNQTRSRAPVFGLTHSLSYQRFSAAICRILLAGAAKEDAVLCTSTSAKTVMARLLTLMESRLLEPGERPDLCLFPLPLPPEVTETPPSQKPDQPFQALYLGRIDWQTKADLLPLAAVIEKLSPLYRFVIAGGDENQSYRDLVRGVLSRKGAVVLGQIDEKKKGELLKASHILISPVDNFQETFGLNLIEAMAAGCVPVATDFDGYRDIVKDGQTGFLLPTLAAPLPEKMRLMQGLVSEDVYHGWWAAAVAWRPEDMVDRLALLAEDRGLWRRMSRAAVEQSRHFQSRECTRRVEALLQRRLAKTPSEATYPFCWRHQDIFFEHPTRWWAGQKMALTEKGRQYLRQPWPIPQLALLSGFFDPEDVRRLLASIQNNQSPEGMLGQEDKALLRSVALKNELLELE